MEQLFVHSSFNLSLEPMCNWKMMTRDVMYILFMFVGIGYETAKNVAFVGANVILAVRTEERGKSVSTCTSELRTKRLNGSLVI